MKLTQTIAIYNSRNLAYLWYKDKRIAILTKKELTNFIESLQKITENMDDSPNVLVIMSQFDKYGVPD